MAERVGVAVSGGADSVYLLYELIAAGDSLTVLHVNHQLRGEESDADERFVRALGEALGLPVLVHCAPVGEGNLEQEAREARYGWFRRLLAEGTVERVALGHTESDQAETVLFRFLRGAGTAGLAGIRPQTVDGFFRPLLHLTRDEIRTSLRNRGLDWREDSSNGDQRFARNRLRSQLLPQLARDWNPAIEHALARTAEWAVAEEDYWEGELDRLAAETFARAEPDLIVRWSEKAPVAVQRRLIRRAIEQAKGDLRQIDFAHVEQIRQLRAGRTSIPGLVVERSFNWLRIGPGRPAPKPFHLAAEIPGEISIGEAGVDFRFELKPAESVYNGDEDQLDWGRVSGALELRNWHPGDQYRRVGHTNDEKLKQLFQRARIPVWERHLWPVLICGNKIAWTRMFGAAAEMARTADTRMILVVTENLAFRNRKL